MAYKPTAPFSVPMYVLTPTTKTVKGVVVKSYSEPTEDNLIFGTFKTFGGTESVSNDVLTIVDTAVIETWYRPDIKSDCRVLVNGKTYEVIGTPENIELRNQFTRFKVQAVAGGA